MLLPLLEQEPVQFTAGDSVSFAKSVPNCAPSDGWVLTYRLFGPLGTAAGPIVDKSYVGVVAGAGWTVTIPATDTAAVVSADTYRLVGRATNAGTGESVIAYDAICRLLANPLTAKPSTLLTHAERCLSLIEAAIEKRLPADLEHYQIDGKVIGKILMRDLLKLRAKYKLEVWRARNPGVRNAQRLVRFSRG